LPKTPKLPKALAAIASAVVWRIVMVTPAKENDLKVVMARIEALFDKKEGA